MVQDQSLTVQDKRELQSNEEQTVPGRFYVPNADIYENAEELVVVLDIPGVEKGDVEVRVENEQLHIEARVNLDKYASFKPVYTEYNIGHFTRTFRLSNKIDSAGINARVDNGVLALRLPKVPEAKPRKIEVS